MTTKTQLAEAFARLTAGLAQLDAEPSDGKARARKVRSSLHEHLSALADEIEGKTAKCVPHERKSCAVCRSEEIAAPQYRPNPIAAIDARVMGERQEEAGW